MGASLNCKCQCNKEEIRDPEVQFEDEQIEVEEYEYVDCVDEEDNNPLQPVEAVKSHKVDRVDKVDRAVSVTHTRQHSADLKIEIYEDEEFANIANHVPTGIQKSNRTNKESKTDLVDPETVLKKESQNSISLSNRDESVLKKDEEDKLLTTIPDQLPDYPEEVHAIIPRDRLINCIDSDVLFYSELLKFQCHEVKTHFAQQYSSRFCVLSKTEFRYYKSKEQFITLQRPLYVTMLRNVSQVDLIKLNGPNCRKHFYINIAKVDVQPNIHSVQSSVDDMKSKRISLLNVTPTESCHLEVNDMEQIAKRNALVYNKDSNESLLIFTSDSEEVIRKWVIILNYLRIQC